MKHLRAKGILSIVAALLLTAALALIYANIGLRTDIVELKKQCDQKISGLQTSYIELKNAYYLAYYDYESILRTNAYLSALPLRKAVRTEGDAAIRMYRNGCVLRVDGDRLILPRDASTAQFHAASFRDGDGELLEWGSFECSMPNPADHDPSLLEESNDATHLCTFTRLSDNYYYVDLTPLDARSVFLGARVSISDTLDDLEKIYGGHILTFDADDAAHTLIYRSKGIGDGIATMGDLGIDVDAPDGGPDSIEVEGDAYVFALSQTVETIESGQPVRERIALLVPIDELSIRRIPRLVMAVCITVLFFLTAACWVMSCMRVFRREAITVQERKQYGVERARRSLIAFGLAGVLTIGLGTFFVNCLMQLYTATQNNMNLLERISVIASETQESAQRAQRTREEIYVNYARRIADLLSEYPRLKTRETLAEMCDAVDADYLMIYDDQGREALSNAPYVNLSFSRDRESTDHEFRLLLTGVPSVVHEACVDEKTLLERQLVGVSMDDGDVSDGYGALIMAIMPNKRYDDMMTMDQLMQTITPADSLCLGLDPESGRILFASDPTLIDENALRLGMTEHDLQSGIMDHFLLNGQRWYSCTDTDDNLIYHGAVQANAIYRRLPVTALAFSSCFLAAYLLLALVLMQGFTVRSIDEHGPRVVEDGEALTPRSNASNRNARSRLNIAVQHLRTTHIGDTPERRTRFVFNLILGILLAGMLVVLEISADGHNKFLLLYYVLNGKWTPGVNLFAFAKILILTLNITVAIMAIRLLTGVLCSLLQKRGETVCRLFSSFLQYVAVLALVFAAFDCLGFDTRALLASVGILSLAVSLGAKDLVADVLSGISIAFSDEYQIGDYIQISDFRGWVQDIGVRSTTLVNNDGNIKHFSNRDVKNILNLSRRNCQYTITVTIASDQPLRKIEEILNRELPRIGKATPEIISGPEYKGVKGFTAGGVTLEIAAECKEHNYGKVRSRINREIRFILEENGIVIK